MAGGRFLAVIAFPLEQIGFKLIRLLKHKALFSPLATKSGGGSEWRTTQVRSCENRCMRERAADANAD